VTDARFSVVAKDVYCWRGARNCTECDAELGNQETYFWKPGDRRRLCEACALSHGWVWWE
jgi:hypothetical protein